MKYKIVGDSSCDISKEMEERMNRCICTAIFLGSDSALDKHFAFDCPVYAEAYRILSLKEPSA